MDDFDSFAADEDGASTSQSAVETRQNGHVPSGITLVLPSLKAIKAAKMGKKSKLKNLSSTQDTEAKKAPRPMKLKPLKEVLMKLIVQLKKKDDYAFFISPVDPSRVQGYAEMIKHPMDLGTMSTKVARGKYRSLEEFTTDFRLVVTNAKMFNPPGTIYHTEADRLEVWGLDHIAKASAHVIEYETDWNIDVEQDEDAALNIDEDEDHVTSSTPREIEGSQVAASPAPSSVPQQYMKRGPRGPYKKGTSMGISEGIDAEGRLPGSKDGVGAFPPGSDWAEMMIALKIKGKRYRTKKERLRIEKEGLPHLHDGSLDYTEMEDPFSLLNVLVPEPLSKPQLNPLYPSPQVNNTAQPLFPGPVNVPSTRPPLTLATLAASTSQSTPRRRHWTIVRNASTRAKLKEKEDDEPQSIEFLRDPFPSDFGSFAAFGAELGASACSEEKLATSIRASIENRPIKRSLKAGVDSEYWTDEKAEEAWDYIRDVVYGGVNGFAYVRSIAEFVRPPEEISHHTEHTHPLGTSVARYVEQHLVDVVTRGRHELLCTTAAYLHSILKEPLSPTMEAQIAASLTFRPTVFRLIQALQHEQLDMAALIRSPDELEKAGLGELGIPEGPAVLEQALECAVQALEELDRKVQQNDRVKVEDDAMDVDKAEEDPVAKKLRLTLLALAKRAPLDKIAPLPAALVPAHIRKIVPTI
ncbi:uncharacterized protein BJ212DRAFT_1322924 [Suillus subaureus]|uniref:Bromo domain-containing protein n=1 Tax=Suillus subaureus TaxID=48587 RepID=A0A9P7JJ32_9AGAM|nr:uncharacterized protein BJ212DRAFT_1322924 [Suillus subaureus]KAG1824864.1 hypothetical protein BJ212DRAFT_1322924 [Suillus subaureus]